MGDQNSVRNVSVRIVAVVERAPVLLLCSCLLHEGQILGCSWVDNIVSHHDGACFDEVPLLEKVKILQVLVLLLVHEDEVEGTNFVEEGTGFVDVLCEYSHVLHARMSQYLLCYFRYFLVDLQTDYPVLWLQLALTEDSS